MTVAARSQAWTAGIVGSIPTQGMYVCMRLVLVFVLFFV
jgi:hypothetical protein